MRPDMVLPIRPANQVPPTGTAQALAVRYDLPVVLYRCHMPGCTYPKGHPGPHSQEEV